MYMFLLSELTKVILKFGKRTTMKHIREELITVSSSSWEKGDLNTSFLQ